MSDDTKDLGKVISPEFIISFPNLFNPKPVMINGKAQGDPRYDLQMLYEGDITELKKAAAAVAKAKWPGRDLKELAFPFKSGDKLADKGKEKGKDREVYRGKVVLSASSQFKPQVIDARGQDIIDPNKVYSGAICRADLNFVAYNGVGANPDGVTCYLNGVLFVRDGERIGGAGDARTRFAGVIGQQTDEDPTSGLDDIPV